MWIRLFILGAVSAIIAFLSAFYLGLITLMIFVLTWCIIFIPPQLDAVRFLRIARKDAYELLKSTNPNPTRISSVIEKLSQYSKDKEARKLIQELSLKLGEDCTINTALKCGDVYP